MSFLHCRRYGHISYTEMDTGGIFQSIMADGRADRMLEATSLLNERLLAIERMRILRTPRSYPTPEPRISAEPR
jgi:hypothetical protein